MLLKQNAYSVEKCKGTTTYIFVCSYNSCNTLIRVRSSYLKKATGLCSKHSHQKRPFEHIFNSIRKDKKGADSTLTYEDFLSFTEVKQCYYCLSNITWEEYAYVDGKFTSKAYFLDRKINSLPYSKENCVVCCTHCNKMKSNLDYDDFIVKCSLISDVFKQRFFKEFEGGGSCGA